ncbi:MAG: hypothetical protein RR276_08810 [Angelakisella sp.]
MTVAITAVFPTLKAAQAAADCLAICPEKSQSLQVSLEHCNRGAVTAASLMLSNSPQTMGLGCAHGQGALVHIRCTDQLSSFAAKELAALGAEKITVTPLN